MSDEEFSGPLVGNSTPSSKSISPTPIPVLKCATSINTSMDIDPSMFWNFLFLYLVVLILVLFLSTIYSFIDCSTYHMSPCMFYPSFWYLFLCLQTITFYCPWSGHICSIPFFCCPALCQSHEGSSQSWWVFFFLVFICLISFLGHISVISDTDLEAIQCAHNLFCNAVCVEIIDKDPKSLKSYHNALHHQIMVSCQDLHAYLTMATIVWLLSRIYNSWMTYIPDFNNFLQSSFLDSTLQHILRYINYVLIHGQRYDLHLSHF